MIETILVPVDGSESSERAVARAIDIAKVCDAKIIFLYVANINQLAINPSLMHAVMDAVKKAGRTILQRAESTVPKGIAKGILLKVGSPADLILEVEEDLDADLIIMGSRGLGTIKGLLLGSVSQYIMERAECPVLVVK